MDNLISYAKKYEKLYKQKINPIFHTAVSCITSQQVAFSVGKNIRKQLYEKCGYPLTKKAISDINLNEISGLTSDRISLILKIAKIDDINPKLALEEYSKLKGFGTWTCGAVSILMDLDSEVNLSSDAYIRKNLSLYLNKELNTKQCHTYIEKANENKSCVCYFLWRIKKTSIDKVSSNKKLSKEDFI